MEHYEIFVTLHPNRITMEKLTRQEEELMLAIWQLESCTVKEAIELLKGTPPPYTTVASVAKNLERKGYVTARKVGNTYLYTPAVKQCDFKRTYLGEIVSGYFRNSYKELVSFFAKEQKLTSDDLKDIIHMIESGEEGEK